MHTFKTEAGWAKLAAILCLLALLISTCFLLGSCGDNETPGGPDNSDVTPDPTPDDKDDTDPNPDDTGTTDPEPEEPKQEFTLTFVVDGEIYKTFKVKEGDTFTDIPEVPELPGYTGAWEISSFENIRESMAVYAVYTPATYTLTFDYAGATEETETTSTEVTYGYSIGWLPTPKKAGYGFEGWYIGEDRIDENIEWEYTENKTATAHFVDYYSEGLEYGKYDDSGWWVSGIGTCTDTDIIVPATYHGTPVTGVAGSAFKNNTQITSVYFGENVYHLDSGIFEGCTSLRSVTFGHTAGFPEDYTPNSNYAYHIFKGCTAFENLTVPTYILELLIERNFGNTYGNLGNLKHITTTAGDTFPRVSECGTLETVVMHEGVLAMEEDTFSDLKLTSVTLPESLTEIPEYAFGGCGYLTSLKIGKNVTVIGSRAFEDCAALAKIVIPEGVTSIGSFAFSRAGSATSGLHIYFAGTEDAWNAVSGLDNAGFIKNVTYHFESTGPEETEE